VRHHAGRTDVFQACVFTGLAHPWRTGHRDAALAALGIAFSPELLNSPQFSAMMQQLEPLFPKTPAQMETVAEQWDADLAHDALDRLEQIAAPTLMRPSPLRLTQRSNDAQQDPHVGCPPGARQVRDRRGRSR
jgi:hypothetical protein